MKIYDKMNNNLELGYGSAHYQGDHATVFDERTTEHIQILSM